MHLHRPAGQSRLHQTWRHSSLFGGPAPPIAASVLAALVILALPNPLVAGDAPQRDLGSHAHPVPDSTAEHRILDEINRTESAPGLERLTGSLPAPMVMSRLEQSLDPTLLRRFGGPGLDVEDLHAAVNCAMRAGGKPHVTMAAGLLLYGGVKQIQRVHLPRLRVGAVGSSYGVTGGLPSGGLSKVNAGMYVLPPRAPGEAPGRRLLLAFNGMRVPLPLPKAVRSARIEIEQIMRPGIATITTRSIQVQLPFRCRGARLGLGGGLSVTPEEATRIRNLRSSFAFRRLTIDLDFRHVDLGWSAYLDTGIRASVRPFRIEGRWRQDPWRRPPAFEARLQGNDLLPYLRRLVLASGWCR